MLTLGNRPGEASVAQSAENPIAQSKKALEKQEEVDKISQLTPNACKKGLTRPMGLTINVEEQEDSVDVKDFSTTPKDNSATPKDFIRTPKDDVSMKFNG